MMARRDTKRYLTVVLTSLLVGCGSDPPASGEGAVGSGACADERQALVQKIQASTACQAAEDCTAYVAPALQAESGNCAGIFYVSSAERASIEALDAARSACLGESDGAGGSCAFGPTLPACVEGVCGASAP